MSPHFGSAKILVTLSTKRLLAKVAESQRDGIRDCLMKFAANPLDPSLKFKRLKSKAPIYSIRVDFHLRVYLEDTGNLLLEIIHIGNHDFLRRVK